MSQTWAVPPTVPVNRVVASSLKIIEYVSDLAPVRYFLGFVVVSFQRMMLF